MTEYTVVHVDSRGLGTVLTGLTIGLTEPGAILRFTEGGDGNPEISVTITGIPQEDTAEFLAWIGETFSSIEPLAADGGVR